MHRLCNMGAVGDVSPSSDIGTALLTVQCSLQFTALFTALHCTALHCTALHCMYNFTAHISTALFAVHCLLFTFHCTALHISAVHHLNSINNTRNRFDSHNLYNWGWREKSFKQGFSGWAFDTFPQNKTGVISQQQKSIMCEKQKITQNNNIFFLIHTASFKGAEWI